MKKIISTSDAPAALGPYSQAVRVGSTIYCAGQIPLDPKTGQIVAGGIEVQTRRVMDNITAILKAEGLTCHNVVKTTIFLADLGDFPCRSRRFPNRERDLRFLFQTSTAGAVDGAGGRVTKGRASGN